MIQNRITPYGFSLMIHITLYVVFIYCFLPGTQQWLSLHEIVALGE